MPVGQAKHMVCLACRCALRMASSGSKQGLSGGGGDKAEGSVEACKVA